MNKSLKEVEEDIIEEFAEFDEWLDKYEYIIDLGKSLDSYPEDKKTDEVDDYTLLSRPTEVIHKRCDYVLKNSDYCTERGKRHKYKE